MKEKPPLVTEYMATDLVTFTPETNIRTAVKIMLKNKISGAPVVNDKGKLVGMLSEVDCMKLLLGGSYYKEPGGLGTVANYMSTELYTINADQDIFYAAYEFVVNGYRRLPVLDKGELVGQISRMDILRAIKKMGPAVERIPDSWRGRVPVIPKHKKGRYNKNA